MECNNHYTQIDQDIKKFENKSIDMNAIGEIIVKKYYQRYTHSFCNYVILNNRVKLDLLILIAYMMKKNFLLNLF